VFAIAAAVEISLLTAWVAKGQWTAADALVSIIFFFPASYAVGYPIYQAGVRRLAAGTGAMQAEPGSPHSVGRLLHPCRHHRHCDPAVRHCGGFPADSSLTNCPVAPEPGGPYLVPQSLLLQQTNARGEIGGPYL
jgi:hypothetical protein